MHEGRIMKKTQSEKWREQIDSDLEQLLELGSYVAPETQQHYRDLKWQEKRDFMGHSVLKTLAYQVRKDLILAKAAKYDAIAPHYEMLMLEEILSGSLDLVG
jgi:hypothetical protein